MMATGGGGGGGAHISYVVYIICSVRITLFMLNISQRSALSHILQLHDSGYFFFVSNRDHDSPTKQNNV